MTLQVSISDTQLWTSRTKEFRTLPEAEDPVRHERLAAAGRIGETERPFRKRMTFFFMYPSDL
jgi:hypothetical protein